MTDVFISRPTWISPDHRAGLDGFEGFLRELDLTPRTLGVTDYPAQSPLDEVIRLMNECSGAIILGIPQIRVEEGTLKGAAIENPLILGTEWNHIEAALAHLSGLPLLIIHDIGVSRGVFDRGTVGRYIYEIDMCRDGWPLTDQIRGAIRTWRGSLRPAGREVSNEEPEINEARNLADEEVAILLLLAEGDGRSLTAIQISRELDTGRQRIEYFLERLSEDEYIFFPIIMNVEPSYELDQRGREFLIENGHL